MFQYVPFCKRRVRLGIFSIICVTIWICLRPQTISQLFNWLFQNKQPPLIPNTVHFFHFVDQQKFPHEGKIEDSRKDVDDLNFVSATCILAAAFNQQPDRIIIHTNANLTLNLANKKYWSLIFRILNPKQRKPKVGEKSIKPLIKLFNTTLSVVHLKQPTHVFGQPLSSAFHAADVARLNVLLTQGGIALDQDTFIVRKLDPTFFHEKSKVTLGKIINYQKMSTMCLFSLGQYCFIDKQTDIIISRLATKTKYRDSNSYFSTQCSFS